MAPLPSLPGYMQALLETMTDHMAVLQRMATTGEDGRRATQMMLATLAERLSMLTEQMRTEQTLLARLAENQIELRPILQSLADAGAASRQTADDDALRQHMRNIDMYLARLVEEVSTGRSQSVSEIRSEIKLLARTISALADETT